MTQIEMIEIEPMQKQRDKTRDKTAKTPAKTPPKAPTGPRGRASKVAPVENTQEELTFADVVDESVMEAPPFEEIAEPPIIYEDLDAEYSVEYSTPEFSEPISTSILSESEVEISPEADMIAESAPALVPETPTEAIAESTPEIPQEAPPEPPPPTVRVIAELEHLGTGLIVAIVEHPSKRTYYTASAFDYEFRNSKREKLEQQITAQLDQIAALEWLALIEAYTRYTPDGAAHLSVDRYWTLTLPAGEILRANWRSEEDDTRSRFGRAYVANLPPGFGPPLPFVEKKPGRQRVWMPFTESAWNTLQASVGRLRQLAAPPVEGEQPAPRPTVYMPQRVARYEIHYKTLERLISEHLELEYSILAGERWVLDSSNILLVSLDGYDDSDRSVVEQIRSGTRDYFALEILMRVLAEKHVLPEGNYLIMGRQE